MPKNERNSIYGMKTLIDNFLVVTKLYKGSVEFLRNLNFKRGSNNTCRIIAIFS